jgi:hypothetical protein
MWKTGTGVCGMGGEGVNPLMMQKPSLSLDKRYKDISKNDKSFDRVLTEF